MRKVCIASDQIVSPLGMDTHENIQALRQGISGILQHQNDTISTAPYCAAKLDEQKLRMAFQAIGNPENYTKLEQMLLLAVHKIFQDFPMLSRQKCGLVISTTKGDITALSAHISKEKQKAKLFELGKTITSFFELKNEAIVLSNACISGGLALAVAKRYIASGKFDEVIVAGGDLLSEFTFSGFSSFQAISDSPCQPFSKNRKGISLGEAAAALLLTSDKSKQKSDSVYISGVGSANDANHISGPSRTGEGLFLSIQKALQEAKISARDIDYVSAHGTATNYNDEMEAIAFNRANLQEISTNSLKGFYGHTLGAAALIEVIVASKSLVNNELYPSLGCKELGVSEPLNIIKDYQKTTLTTALKTASGFGGCNVALILHKGHDFPCSDESKNSSALQNIYHRRSVRLTDKGLFINNKKQIDKASAQNLAEFLKTCYTHLGMSYPKFHKMDKLCKLGMIGAESLWQAHAFSEDTPIVLANHSSSLDTDAKHLKSIENKQDYFPSPSVFVYTLPNIILGEMSIKYKLKSDQAFFVSEFYHVDLIWDYAHELLKSQESSDIVVGWVEVFEEKFDLCMSLLSTSGGEQITKEKLKTLYNQKL